MRIAISGVELEAGEGLVPLTAACEQLDVRQVELWHPKNTSPDGTDAFVDELATHQIEVGCMSAGIELFRDSGSEHQQAELMALIDFASGHGVGLVNTYFGFSSTADDDRSIEGYCHWVAPCLARAEAKNVVILIENEFDAFEWDPMGSDVTRRPHSLRRLMETLSNPHIGLTFDPANFLCASVDPLEAFEELHPHIRHVHVKDAVALVGSNAAPREGWRRYTDHGRAFSTCALGEGDVPWPEIIRSLRKVGYAGALCMEPHSVTARRGTAWTEATGYLRSLLAAEAV
jgi:sugar phosphate isomerase/epimerase